MGSDPNTKDPSDVKRVQAAPTRRTLIFPSADAIHRDPDLEFLAPSPSPPVFARRLPPPLPPRARAPLPAVIIDPTLCAPLVEEKPRSNLALERSSAHASASIVESEPITEALPSSRPSERPTKPTLPPPAPGSADSGDEMVLSGSVLESDISRAELPPASSGAIERAKRAWYKLPPSVVVNIALVAMLGLVLVTEKETGPRTIREPKVALGERTPLVRPEAAREPAPPSGGCVTTGTARIVARRAQLGPGVDVTPLDTGFALGLATSTTEALAVRIEGSNLRVAETVRVRSQTAPKHVAATLPLDDGDSLDVRIDADDARTIVPDESPALRVAARGGFLFVEGNGRTHSLWPLPGAALRPSGFSRIASRPSPTGPETLRAAPRDEGGVVLALKRPSTLFVGVTDGSFVPQAPLVAIQRPNANVGTPSVAAFGGGGAIAWAERATSNARDWSIVAAVFGPDGEASASVGPLRVIGTGMSPSIVALPDGDLLLAYAEGPSGAHRVVARRLTRDLSPRGEPIVLSPEATNAGQPTAAIRGDGRGVVAFFAAERGRAASVLATPVVCDPGL